MLKKIFTMCMITLLAMGAKGVYGQAMHITLQDGSKVEYALERINKLTFESGEVNIFRSNNTTDAFPLANLQLVHFTEEVSGINETVGVDSKRIVAYPNPVTSTLTVDLSGMEDFRGTISIMAIDGRVVKTIPANHTSNVHIDMGNLPKGLYILRYYNTSNSISTLKIVKQ